MRKARRAVAAGIQTWWELAEHWGISIRDGSEQCRVVQISGWIVRADGRYPPRRGIRHRLVPASQRAEVDGFAPHEAYVQRTRQPPVLHPMTSCGKMDT